MHAEPSDVSVSLLKGRAWVRVLVVAWFPLLCAGLWAFAPHADGSWILCAFRRATRVPCPSCGMTRAVGWLLRGDVPASLRYHPLGGLTLALLFGTWVYGMGVAVRGWSVSIRAAVWVAIAFEALLIAVWLFRLTVWAGQGGLPPELRIVASSR